MKYGKENPMFVSNIFSHSLVEDKFTGFVRDISGNTVSYLNGKFHNSNEPAVRIIGDYDAWFLNNKRHRADGPAVIFHYGKYVKLWCFDDVKYGQCEDFTNESWMKFTSLLVLK